MAENITEITLDLYNPYKVIWEIITNKVSDLEAIRQYNKSLCDCKDNGEYPLIKREYSIFIDLLKERGEKKIKSLHINK